MSLFGSIFTGVSALSAQSQSIAMISNNVANVNTTGFKRSEAAFNSLVTTLNQNARFSPGSVTVDRQLQVTEQGNFQQTNSPTDIAISGSGFFVVNRTTGDLQEPIYTRNGNFAEDAQGFLRNSAGFVLQGFPLDENGELPATRDLTDLEPVDVAFLGGLTRPTSQAEIALNLNADEPFTSFPVDASTTDADFSRAIRVFDSLGSPQDLVIDLNHIEAPTAFTIGTTSASTSANVTLSTQLTDLGISTDTDFSITVGATPPETTPIDTASLSTMGDLIAQINSINGVDSSLNSDGDLRIQGTRFPPEDITLADTAGTPPDALQQLGFATGTGATVAISASSVPGTSVLTSGGLDDNTDPNTGGWWNMRIERSDGTVLNEGVLNFGSNGRLNASENAEGEIDISLTNIDWGNASALQDIDIDVSRLTQFSGPFNVIFTDQNGAELGLRTGVEVSREGVVSARFTNGQTAEIFQLPLATFANPNGLSEVNGQGYSETQESGSFNLRLAGEGGAGLIESSTLEGSNVDLADEFSRLIVSQRAYSAGTRVISAADELTEELLRLR